MLDTDLCLVQESNALRMGGTARRCIHSDNQRDTEGISHYSHWLCTSQTSTDTGWASQLEGYYVLGEMLTDCAFQKAVINATIDNGIFHVVQWGIVSIIYEEILEHSPAQVGAGLLG